MPIVQGKYILTGGLIPFFQGKRASAFLMAKQKSSLQALPVQTQSMAAHIHCVRGQGQDFSGQKVVLVAHWDVQGRVDIHVQQQCRYFKEMGHKVILCSAAPLSSCTCTSSEQDYAHAIIYRTCEGYDFTSWKAALEFFPSIGQCEELVLTNDSYFGPLQGGEKGYPQDIAAIHAHMHTFDCDFWGMTFSMQRYPHIQSYYLVLRKKAVQSAALADFFSRVPLSSQRGHAVELELAFTSWLAYHGLRPAAYAVPLCMGYEMHAYNPTLHLHRHMYAHGIPFMKKEVLRSEDGYIFFKNACTQRSASEKALYPWAWVDDYFLRLRSGPNTDRGTGKVYGHFPPDVLCCYEALDRQKMSLAPPPKEQKALSLSQNVPLHISIFVQDMRYMQDLLPYLQHMPREGHVHILLSQSLWKAPIHRLLHPLGFASLVYHTEILDAMQGFLQVVRAVQDDSALLVNIQAAPWDFTASLRSSMMPDELAALDATARRIMYEALCGTAQRVQALWQCLLQNPQLGMVTGPFFPPYARSVQGAERGLMQELLQSQGISLPPDAAVDYALQGQFWARAETVRMWADIPLDAALFARFARHGQQGALGVALEKVLFFGCGLKGKTWSRVL